MVVSFKRCIELGSVNTLKYLQKQPDYDNQSLN